MVCDALGYPVEFVTTGGNVHDAKVAGELIQGLKGKYLLGDKGYDSQALIDQAASQGMIAVIPPKSNRKTPRFYDKQIYRERNAVERLFAHLKENRRITTRYEKSKISFDGLVYLACAIYWLK